MDGQPVPTASDLAASIAAADEGRATSSPPPRKWWAGLVHRDRRAPTLVINSEYDGLRASGEAATAALIAANVPTRQLLARGVAHGHLNSPHLAQAQESFQDIADWLVNTSDR